MSVHQKNSTPRKKPRQARSKMTVDAILIAGSQVLVEEGYEKTTTAKVAERAGVSIGTLYQYFSNKESLVGSLIEQNSDMVVTDVQNLLVRKRSSSLVDIFDSVIQTVFSIHRIDPVLHRILHEQAPVIGRSECIHNALNKITRLFEICLKQHADSLPKGLNHSVSAAVITTILESFAHKSILDTSTSFNIDVAATEAYRSIINHLKPVSEIY